ncbi:MAG: long-chain fatty acid--CoA ligase [Candidatus Eremiobacteraeota bacterium]|nr:long-chain fatty acid--CoA ligase [Candidatus Eremiobacteraeota bacterium]
MVQELPWMKSYPPPARWDADIEVGPVSGLLEAAAATYADRPALEFMGKRATYRQLLELTERAAKGFQELGVRPGVHVGLFLPNTPHYVIAFFGVLKAGGTVVNYSPLDAADVLAHKVDDSETVMIVTLDMPMLLPQMAALLDTTRLEKLIVGSLADIGGMPEFAHADAHAGGQSNGASGDARRVSFSSLLDNDGRYRRYEIGDPAQTIAVIQYTGGTTGLPKGAMLTHANLTAAANQYKETTKIDPPLLLEGTERTLLVLPLFHIYSLTSVMLLSIKFGSEIIIHSRFDAAAIAKDIGDKKVTIFFGVPTMYTALISLPDIKQYDLSSLKYCGSGGAPLPLEVQRTFERLTGCPVREGWGMTETSPSGTFTPARGRSKEGSCGLPVPRAYIKFASVDDPTRDVPLGERGEICIKGPNVMKGYWKNPEATANMMTSDGYLRTGDVGYMDSDGFVFIVDRIKDMLLCGGFNVYPRNIEEAIYKHPAVAEVCVIGIPDEYRGESPKAFITLKKGTEAFSFDELKAFLKDKLGKHEMVQAIEFRDELPKTPVGKIKKAALVEEEAARRSEAGTATQ